MVLIYSTSYDFDPSADKACVLENSAYAAFLKGSPKYGSIKQVPKPGLFKMAEALVAGDCHGIIERVRVLLNF